MGEKPTRTRSPHGYLKRRNADRARRCAELERCVAPEYSANASAADLHQNTKNPWSLRKRCISCACASLGTYQKDAGVAGRDRHFDLALMDYFLRSLFDTRQCLFFFLGTKVHTIQD